MTRRDVLLLLRELIEDTNTSAGTETSEQLVSYTDLMNRIDEALADA